MGITREAIKDLKYYFKRYGLDRVFIRGVDGKMIQDKWWYDWLLNGFDTDIYDVDELYRYDLWKLSHLFGDDVVKEYCTSNGVSVKRLFNGLGGAYSQGGVDDVKSLVRFIDTMYGELIVKVREGSKFRLCVKRFEYVGDGSIDLRIGIDFIPGQYRGIDFYGGSYWFVLSVNDKFNIDGDDYRRVLNDKLKDYLDRYYIRAVFGDSDGLASSKDRFNIAIDSVLLFLHKLKCSGIGSINYSRELF